MGRSARATTLLNLNNHKHVRCDNCALLSRNVRTSCVFHTLVVLGCRTNLSHRKDDSLLFFLEVNGAVIEMLIEIVRKAHQAFRRT